MVLEIERKFILHNLSVLKVLNSDGIAINEDEIMQFYTKITPISEIRFRKINDKFFTTQKFGKGLVREELENEISKDTFEKALKNSIAIPVKKSRFSFKINNLPCNIDVFSDALEGLITFEIEFLTIKDAKEFFMPDFIKTCIKSEITDDERYKNKNLALFGLPQNDFNTVKCFEALIKNPELKLPFSGSIRAIDALRIVLFGNLRLILLNLDTFYKNNDLKSLHKLRVNLRKSRSLLGLFGEVFDKKVGDFFATNFKTLANKTNTKRDIDSFTKFLITQKKQNNKVIEILNQLSKNESQRLIQTIKNSNVTELFKEWELFLKEQSDFYKGEKFDENIKRLTAKILRLQIIKVRKQLIKLNNESKNEQFHATRKQIKKLRYASETFIDLFAIKALEKCVKKTKIMQDLFGYVQDSDAWLKLLNSAQWQYGSQKLKEKIQKISLKNKQKILEKKFKFSKNLNLVSQNLKIYYI